VVRRGVAADQAFKAEKQNPRRGGIFTPPKILKSGRLLRKGDFKRKAERRREKERAQGEREKGQNAGRIFTRRKRKRLSRAKSQLKAECLVKLDEDREQEERTSSIAAPGRAHKEGRDGFQCQRNFPKDMRRKTRTTRSEAVSQTRGGEKGRRRSRERARGKTRVCSIQRKKRIEGHNQRREWGKKKKEAVLMLKRKCHQA